MALFEFVEYKLLPRIWRIETKWTIVMCIWFKVFANEARKYRNLREQYKIELQHLYTNIGFESISSISLALLYVSDGEAGVLVTQLDLHGYHVCHAPGTCSILWSTKLGKTLCYKQESDNEFDRHTFSLHSLPNCFILFSNVPLSFTLYSRLVYRNAENKGMS